jgi:hypothetical protein
MPSMSLKGNTKFLSKLLKYSLHHKSNKWIRTLAIDVETAISYMIETKQNYRRHVIVITIKP